jgi:uncharacterized protein (DUF934 family)
MTSLPLLLIDASSNPAAASAITSSATQTQVLRLPNDADLSTLDLHGVARIELDFPKVTDGRAFSQAVVLRRRHGFVGDIRAGGDVRVDLLQQLSRCGFTSAVLPNTEAVKTGRQLLARFSGFYQGDALHAVPHFVHQPTHPSVTPVANTTGARA